MTDRHRDPSLNVRPPAETLAAAQSVLSERSLEMRGFVTACLAAVADEPDFFLGILDGYWPPRKRGRPRKAGTANADRPAPPSEDDRAADDAPAD